MSGMARVPVHQSVGKFVTVEPGATKGAVVGVSLYRSDGSIVTEADLGLSSSSGGSGSGAFVWRSIREVPAAVAALAARGVSSAANGALSPNVDTDELVIRTALNGATTINNPTGTTSNGQRLRIRLRDDGTGRALTWDTQFRAMTAALPATTAANKTIALEFWRNETESTWDLITRADQP